MSEPRLKVSRAPKHPSRKGTFRLLPWLDPSLAFMARMSAHPSPNTIRAPSVRCIFQARSGASWLGQPFYGWYRNRASPPLFSPLQRAFKQHGRPTPKGPLLRGALWDAGCDTLLRGASEKVYGPILGTDSPLLRCSSYVAWLRAWDSLPRRREAPATSPREPTLFCF